MGDPRVTLNSFIVANTRYGEVEHWGLTKADFEERHVLFQRNDSDTYVGSMIERILASSGELTAHCVPTPGAGGGQLDL